MTVSMFKKVFLIQLIFSQFQPALTQVEMPDEERIYQVNRKLEIPFIFGLYASNSLGFHLLQQKPILSSSQIASMDINDVWFFDRSAVKQSYSSSERERARRNSDWGLYTSIVLAGVLLLDKEIQKDYVNIILLYLEAHAISSTLYLYPGPMFLDRTRPFVYYPEIPLEEKQLAGSTDSFYSGHVATAATATFFMAKIFTDYHPETQGKKWLYYTSALIPPAFVGYNRYKALKHFPTDVLIGMAFGAATGILLPAIHRFRPVKNQNLSIVPFTGSVTGMNVQFRF